MIVKPCPKCGRMPKIIECVNRKTSKRRRMCHATCYHSYLDKTILRKFPEVEKSWDGFFKTSHFVFLGEGDDNTIYKIWNEALIDG